MNAALSPVEIWREMRLHLEWSKGLVPVVLFAESSAALAPLRQWVGDAGQERTVPIKRLTPDNAVEAVVQVLGGLEAQAQAMPDVRAPVWVEMLAHTTPTQAWEAARAECLARLNEAREWLTNTFKRPLVLCLPTAWLAQIGPVAPDLWHVRSYAATVLSPPASKPMRSIFSTPDVASGVATDAAQSDLTSPSQRLDDDPQALDDLAVSLERLARSTGLPLAAITAPA